MAGWVRECEGARMWQGGRGSVRVQGCGGWARECEGARMWQGGRGSVRVQGCGRVRVCKCAWMCEKIVYHVSGAYSSVRKCLNII